MLPAIPILHYGGTSYQVLSQQRNHSQLLRISPLQRSPRTPEHTKPGLHNLYQVCYRYILIQTQSPDLNIIEAVWDHLDRERNKRQPTSKEELWDVLQEAWRTIPEDSLKE